MFDFQTGARGGTRSTSCRFVRIFTQMRRQDVFDKNFTSHKNARVIDAVTPQSIQLLAE
jgi:hypothetical protein